MADVWFCADVRGLENIPPRGPVLLVGNHSGGMLIADTFISGDHETYRASWHSAEIEFAHRTASCDGCRTRCASSTTRALPLIG
jgi:hypothetical protein